MEGIPGIDILLLHGDRYRPVLNDNNNKIQEQNNMKIYKIKKQTIWHWSYRWTDDQASELGYEDLKGDYIGTKKEFMEMRAAEE